MISLDFNNSVFDCSACSALLLELLGKLFKFCLPEVHTGNQTDPAAFAAFGLPANTHHAVALLPAFFLATALFCLFGFIAFMTFVCV